MSSLVLYWFIGSEVETLAAQRACAAYATRVKSRDQCFSPSLDALDEIYTLDETTPWTRSVLRLTYFLSLINVCDFKETNILKKN